MNNIIKKNTLLWPSFHFVQWQIYSASGEDRVNVITIDAIIGLQNKGLKISLVNKAAASEELP